MMDGLGLPVASLSPKSYFKVEGCEGKKRESEGRKDESRRLGLRVINSCILFYLFFLVACTRLQNLIGKKVEVRLRLFDIFERNMVFLFLLESWESQPPD